LSRRPRFLSLEGLEPSSSFSLEAEGSHAAGGAQLCALLLFRLHLPLGRGPERSGGLEVSGGAVVSRTSSLDRIFQIRALRLTGFRAEDPTVADRVTQLQSIDRLGERDAVADE
jgi:hypothetical protein